MCIACNSSNNAGTEPVPQHSGSAKSTLNNVLTKQIVHLLHEYYQLKDALVEGDTSKVNTHAKQISAISISITSGTEYDSIAKNILQAPLDTLHEGIYNIVTSVDGTCEVQRVKFEKVSNGMYQIIKAAGISNIKIYVQYCPMALNDKGAHWLSDKPEIENPYFGKKMLECGEILETIE